MRKNKKAIAPLVATVLLIVIVIAAAGIIWVVVRELLGGEIIGTACLSTNGMTIDESWTCWDTAGEQGNEYNLTQFKVSRDSEEFELLDISVKLGYGGNSIVKRLSRDFGRQVPMNILEERVYKINYTEWGISEDTKVSSIAIAPVIKVGDKENPCDFVSTVTLDPCALY